MSAAALTSAAPTGAATPRDARHHRVVERPRPFARQGLLGRSLPFLGAMALAFAVVPLPPHLERLTPILMAVGLNLLIVATAFAMPWHRLPDFAQVVPPMAYFVVIALLREAQAGATSYAPLAMLPVFWLALYGTRRELAIGILGVAATFITPLVLLGPPDYPLSEWQRTILFVAVAPLVGFTVQRLVGQLRERAADSARRTDALRRSEAETHSMLVKMAAVTEATREISRTTDTRATRTAICSAACKISGAAFALLVEPADEAHLAVTEAVGTDVPVGMRIALGREPSGAAVAFLSRTPFFVADLAGHPAVSRRITQAAGAVSAHFEPVLRDDDAIGVLVLGWEERIAGLSDAAESGIRMLVAEAAIAIDRADLLEQLAVSARTDDLTGLPNRRAWEEQLPRELARSGREAQPVCVAMLDLDCFKRFNDDRGHQSGDRLLKQSAAAWMGELRTTDMLARYGGEEFSLVLPGCTVQDAEALVERIRSAMPSDQTVSAGIACWDGQESAEALVGRADSALYEAKKAGRDRLVTDGTVIDFPAASSAS